MRERFHIVARHVKIRGDDVAVALGAGKHGVTLSGDVVGHRTADAVIRADLALEAEPVKFGVVLRPQPAFVSGVQIDTVAVASLQIVIR